MYDQDFINDCLIPPSRPSQPLMEYRILAPDGSIAYQGRLNYKCRRIAAKIKGTSNGAMKHIWPQVLKEAGYTVSKVEVSNIHNLVNKKRKQ
jgi:hypothetical protein